VTQLAQVRARDVKCKSTQIINLYLATLTSLANRYDAGLN